MRLKVLKASTRWRGKSYAIGDTIELDETEHNAAAQVRFLKAVGRVAEVNPIIAPVGRVATTAPATAAEPAPERDADAEKAPEAPTRRGRYQRRDLTSD